MKGGLGGYGLSKYGGIGGRGGNVYLKGCKELSLKSFQSKTPDKRFMAGKGKDSR